ncbi:hypothetical protein F5X98DRAFT_307155 [Xylaria grammica]|nr:hypothetical protein F5X98DRAFT_307155 [Xylaria grammica]
MKRYGVRTHSHTHTNTHTRGVETRRETRIGRGFSAMGDSKAWVMVRYKMHLEVQDALLVCRCRCRCRIRPRHPTIAKNPGSCPRHPLLPGIIDWSYHTMAMTKRTETEWPGTRTDRGKKERNHLHYSRCSDTSDTLHSPESCWPPLVVSRELDPKAMTLVRSTPVAGTVAVGLSSLSREKVRRCWKVSVLTTFANKRAEWQSTR